MNMKMKLYNEKEIYEHEMTTMMILVTWNLMIMIMTTLMIMVMLMMILRTHLELADLRVKGEGVKEHRTDEGDVGRLAGQSIQKLAWENDYNLDGFSSTINTKVSLGKLLQFGWIQIGNVGRLAGQALW